MISKTTFYDFEEFFSEDNNPEKIQYELSHDLEYDKKAEEYHLSILLGSERKNSYNCLQHEAEKALRSAPRVTWSEFLKKWGEKYA